MKMLPKLLTPLFCVTTAVVGTEHLNNFSRNRLDEATLQLFEDAHKAYEDGNMERFAELRGIPENRLDSSRPQSWRTECRVITEFEAEIFAVPDPSNVPEEIEWAFETLDRYWKTDDGGDFPYPGDFTEFMHKDGFRVMMVDYEKLPQGVRKWREARLLDGTPNEQKYIAVVGSKAFFAPGVVTKLLPRFAVKDVEEGMNECEKQICDFLETPFIQKWGLNSRFVSGYANIMQLGSKVTLQIWSEKQQGEFGNEERKQDAGDEL